MNKFVIFVLGAAFGALVTYLVLDVQYASGTGDLNGQSGGSDAASGHGGFHFHLAESAISRAV